MEAKTSFSTKFTAVSVTILTVAIMVILMTKDVNAQSIGIGIAVLACLIFFAWILNRHGAVDRKRDMRYEIK